MSQNDKGNEKQSVLSDVSKFGLHSDQMCMPPWHPPTFKTMIKLLFIVIIEMDINEPL